MLMNQWWPEELRKYATCAKTIVHMDETGLFFRFIPDRSLVHVSEGKKVVKKIKEKSDSSSLYELHRHTQTEALSNRSFKKSWVISNVQLQFVLRL